MIRDNSAGASANATYESRLSRHSEKARRRRPYLLAFAAALAVLALVLVNLNALIDVPATLALYATLGGWLSVALAVSAAVAAFATPSHITAWAKGAEGERRTARDLEPLASEGFRILHDRRIPGARSANIDHVVIGPPGVYVVETKSAGGRLRVRDGVINVQGRRKPDWVDEVRREAIAVQSVLETELAAIGVYVTPIICVHRAELPLLSASVDGIPIVSGRDLVRRLRKQKKVLDAETVSRLAQLADERLKPAAVARAAPSEPVSAPGVAD